MQKRGFRLTLFTLLLVSAVGAGLVAWSAEQRVHALSSAELNEGERLNRIAELVATLASVQLAYSASPQTNDGWFGHVSRLVDRIDAETTSLRAQAGSNDPSPHLRALTDALGVVVQAMARAQENLSAGRDLMAADLVLGETRENVDAMAESVRQLQTARALAFATERNALEQRAWTVIGSAAGLWALGLLVLAMPRRTKVAAAPSTPAIPSIDLAAAAELCAAIARVTTAEEVPALLARSAAILEASGIILWLRAGEQLVAIGSHGYERALLNRVSPIPLSARNATTAAWHASEIRTVPGDAESHAAIAAPILGSVGCVGVLAVEVRQGHETENATRAVIAMIAAQLSTAVAPWPTAGAEATATATQDEPVSDLPLRAAGA